MTPVTPPSTKSKSLGDLTAEYFIVGGQIKAVPDDVKKMTPDQIQAARDSLGNLRTMASGLKRQIDELGGLSGSRESVHQVPEQYRVERIR